MTVAPAQQGRSDSTIRKEKIMGNWIVWLGIGVVSVIGGLLAFVNPFAATLAVEQLAGWILLVVGISGVLSAFGATNWTGRLAALAFSFITAAAGFYLATNPLQGAVSLTLVVAVSMLISGVIKIQLAMIGRGTPFFWMTLLSGAISILLTGMILTNLPQAAEVLLGYFLAVELVVTGVAMISSSLQWKDQQNQQSG